MAREERLKLLRRIARKRGSKVIAFVTSDRPNLYAQIQGDVISVLHNHITDVHKGSDQKLDLFIYSRGGNSDVPWSLVSMFREYIPEGHFGVLVPYRAHSAATMIAIGADEIVMGRKAELGPIDITMRGPYNEKDAANAPNPISVEDVMGYFKLLDRAGIQTEGAKVQAFADLSAKVHPMALGSVSRLLSQTELVAQRILGTRREPHSEDDNRRIVRMLASEIYSHQHAISRTEAINHVGLKHVTTAEDAGLDKDLWDLYLEYESFFQFETPFDPDSHLIQNNLDEATWPNLPLMSVESDRRLDVFRTSTRVRRLRQVPPEITLNLNLSQLPLPQISIPALPAGITQQQFDALVQQVVQGAIAAAVNQAVAGATQAVLQSLPLQGFQRLGYDSYWRREV